MKKYRFGRFSLGRMLNRQSQTAVLCMAILLIGLIGAMDYLSGWEYSLSVFYALPIAVVAWKTNQCIGFAFAFLGTAVWWGSRFQIHPQQTGFGFALTGFGWLFYFAVLVIAVSTLQQRQMFYLAEIDRLKRAKREILWASEREQRRIGHDLHDMLGPELVAIEYAASVLTTSLQKKQHVEATQSERIRKMASDSSLLLRKLAQGIYPQHLDEFGLSAALEELTRTLSRTTGVSVCFYETGNTQVEDPENSMHLYRIAQEALNNALKHGKSKNITLVLYKNEHLLRFTIVDDGRGMCLSPAPARPGMGLQTMRYRARALGGDLKIESNPSKGTCVSCEIPYSKPRS